MRGPHLQQQVRRQLRDDVLQVAPPAVPRHVNGGYCLRLLLQLCAVRCDPCIQPGDARKKRSLHLESLLNHARVSPERTPNASERLRARALKKRQLRRQVLVFSPQLVHGITGGGNVSLNITELLDVTQRLGVRVGEAAAVPAAASLQNKDAVVVLGVRCAPRQPRLLLRRVRAQGQGRR